MLNYSILNVVKPVVGLSEIAVDARYGRCHDDATKLLLAEIGPGGFGGHEGSPQVDSIDQIPVSVLNLDHRAIPQNSGIIHEDIDPSKTVDGSFHDFITFLDRVVIGNCFTPFNY